MQFKQTLEYLNQFTDYETILNYNYEELGLECITRLLSALGNPEKSLLVIHIAGTKGKGSTAAITARILQDAGYKVGLYTSPHLRDIRERISINDELISENSFTEVLSQIKAVVKEATYFEILTALAFLYFRDEKVDLAILETGLGGRLDATNVIAKPLAVAITPISREHTALLGDTLEEIAREKSGIIKPGVPVVSAPQPAEVTTVIRKIAQERKAPLFIAGCDFDIPDYEISLSGDHQKINAALAIKLAQFVPGIDLKEETIKAALKKINWPGRLEIIDKDPFVVLDGAQNVASARALKAAIQKYFKYNKLFLILGVSADKDVKGMLRELEALSEKIILTKSSSPRALDPLEMKKLINKKEALVAADVNSALEKARSLAHEDDLILITGSLYLIGELSKCPSLI